jgi:hypothetical protein
MSQMAMPGPAGPPLNLSETREASGTAWLPDSSPMRASMTRKGPWMLMAHGLVFGEFIRAAGSRGDDHGGSINWVMGSARRTVPGGDLTVRAMLSLEPLTVGKCGYPDLVQSGESCDGRALHDRQHPHDLFMELAADYRRALSGRVAMEVYAGLAGDPALGPAAYPHRASTASNPMAPVSHHWLDSSHISFGVVTGALYGRRWKAEVSAFNGREPDDQRYGLDLARPDSWSGRVWWTPSERWAAQLSSGRLTEAERDHHGAPVSLDRTTASVTYHRALSGGRWWASTIAWGTNTERQRPGSAAPPGPGTSAALAETAVDIAPRATLFARAEVVDKAGHDLDVSLADTDRVFTISKLQIGMARVFARWRGIEARVGGSVGVAMLPRALESLYGRRAPGEFTVFVMIQPGVSMNADEGHP